MQTLGDRVRWARDHKLWTQKELAEATGLTEATISKIENGKYQRRPYRETLESLAGALDVSVRWLAFGETTEGKPPARSDRAGERSLTPAGTGEGRNSVPDHGRAIPSIAAPR